jgi:iron complex transport system ATP-binding protein
MASETQGLRVHRASYRYVADTVLSDVSLQLPPACMLALAGPNGSGKTTLLKLMTGSQVPAEGEVRLDGRPLSRLSSRQRAQRIAVVPQHVNPLLAFHVEALVGMGRTPHSGFFGTQTAADRRAVGEALLATDAAHLAARRFSDLSGGEQQRVVLAMALAQQTQYLLLDEPTVHLDLHHQHELLELLRRLHATRRLGILAVMHDLNLASLYFDRLAVLSEGRLIAHGPAADTLLRPEVISVFRAPLTVISHPQAGVPQLLLERDG